MKGKIIILALVFGLISIAMATANQENIIRFKLFTWNTSDNPESINESITFKAGNNIQYYVNSSDKSLNISVNQNPEFQNATINNILYFKDTEDFITNSLGYLYIQGSKTNFFGSMEGKIDVFNSSTWNEAYISVWSDENTNRIAIYVYDDYEGSGSTAVFYYDHADYSSEFDTQSLKIKSLSGTGNAYACLDTNGKLFRSTSPCV